MIRRKDLTGQRFGRWTVLGYSHSETNWQVYWDVKCDCGSVSKCPSFPLLHGKSTSCGCYRNEQVAKTHTTHGCTNTPEYSTWESMKDRCLNKRHKHYSYYGGRGISVCKRWTKSFILFLQDMGKRPTKKHTLDRINNKKGYSKSNCRWATRKEQGRNTKQNRLFIYKGKKRCVAEIAELSGFKETVLRTRLNNGWNLKDALRTPVNPNGKNFV